MMTPQHAFSISLNLLSKVRGGEALTLHVLCDVALDILSGAAERARRPRRPWRARWTLHVHGA